ncbi:MAG: hypothetical protein COB67_13570 [SAR324 cluster bacterium]|uniref:LPS export ABC transporter permease LptG n=1 Tax=SAR324 cluster bacterium TaxID=2024889 RepID=A0A2A4SM42_9DELT|nr:MAG: hypothetical protein COB67_13570 [SAR324 cluster bacterium]
MRILGRYIAKEFITYFLSCLTSCAVLFITFAILGEIDTLEQEGGGQKLLRQLLASIPIMFETIIPITVMLATVLTFSSLCRKSEVVAMTAAGLSVFQLVRPVLLFALLIAGFAHFNQSYLAPLWGADQQFSFVQAEKEEHEWRFFQGQLFYFSKLDAQRQRIEAGKIFQFRGDHQLRGIQDLQRLELKEKQWYASKYQTTNLQNQQVRQEEKQWQVVAQDDFPVAFTPELKNPKYSTFAQVWSDIQIKKQGGVDYDDVLFAFYQKIAGLLSIFVMIFLALPFSIFSGRSANARLGIVISIVLSFIYWLVEQIMMSLHGAGILPPEIAAFGANTLFFLLATSLIYMKKA